MYLSYFYLLLERDFLVIALSAIAASPPSSRSGFPI